MKKRIRLLSIAVQIDDFPKKSSETRGIARPQSTQVQIIVTRGLFYNYTNGHLSFKRPFSFSYIILS